MVDGGMIAGCQMLVKYVIVARRGLELACQDKSG